MRMLRPLRPHAHHVEHVQHESAERRPAGDAQYRREVHLAPESQMCVGWEPPCKKIIPFSGGQ
jgi:hypothetical protein